MLMAYLLEKHIVLGQHVQKRQIIWYTSAMALFSFCVALSLQLTDSLGNYRGLYCCIKEPSDPRVFWPLTIFMLIIWAKVYYHFSRLQNFMRTQVQQFDPKTSQFGSWAKASRAQCRIRVASYSLVCNFLLSWSPIYLMGAVAYGMGFFDAEYPLGLDIIAEWAEDLLTSKTVEAEAAKLCPYFASWAYVKNLNLADLRQKESKCSTPGDLPSPPVLLKCPTPRSNNRGVNMPVLLPAEEVPTVDVLVPKKAITIASLAPQQPKSSPGSNASSCKASPHSDSEFTWDGAENTGRRLEARRASGASDGLVGVGQGGKPRRSPSLDRLRGKIVGDHGGNFGFSDLNQEVYDEVLQSRDLSMTKSEVIEERMMQRANDIIFTNAITRR
eukprot:g69276.t1